MQLRQTVKREVLDKLDSTHFTSDDFEVVFGEAEDFANLIEISFKYDENFVFQVMLMETQYYITMKPGEMFDEGSSVKKSLEEVLGEIVKWSGEVKNELKAGGKVYEKLGELRDLISEQLGSQSDDDEFSVEEINDLKKKFQELEQRVIQLEVDKVITEKQLAQFKDGIEQVSEDIEYYPKETWLKTAPNKLVKLVVAIGKSKEGRKLITDSARKLLGLE